VDNLLQCVVNQIRLGVILWTVSGGLKAERHCWLIVATGLEYRSVDLLAWQIFYFTQSLRENTEIES
jgi:hypothetical protein